MSWIAIRWGNSVRTRTTSIRILQVRCQAESFLCPHTSTTRFTSDQSGKASRLLRSATRNWAVPRHLRRPTPFPFRVRRQAFRQTAVAMRSSGLRRTRTQRFCTLTMHRISRPSSTTVIRLPVGGTTSGRGTNTLHQWLSTARSTWGRPTESVSLGYCISPNGNQKSTQEEPGRDSKNPARFRLVLSFDGQADGRAVDEGAIDRKSVV